MKYQKIANLIHDASNQPSKFRAKNWVEINDESSGTYNVNSQIKFKSTMLNLAYAIIVMHISLLKELLLLIRLLEMLMQIILIKRQYLKVVLHSLIG